MSATSPPTPDADCFLTRSSSLSLLASDCCEQLVLTTISIIWPSTAEDLCIYRRFEGFIRWVLIFIVRGWLVVISRRLFRF